MIAEGTGLRRSYVVVASAVALAGLAHAQAPGVAGRELRFGPRTPADEVAQATLDQATAYIDMAVDENGRNLRPLTPEESRTPLLDLALVKEVMDVAQASAAGAACQLDWEGRNYLKMMRRERARGDLSTHQLGAISLAHRFTMSRFEMVTTCPPGQRERTEEFYRRKWQ